MQVCRQGRTKICNFGEEKKKKKKKKKDNRLFILNQHGEESFYPLKLSVVLK
jgi:hypothetical protein